jgi:dihydrofolate reductase
MFCFTINLRRWDNPVRKIIVSTPITLDGFIEGPGEIHFARSINSLPKIVFSRSLQQAGWDTTIKRAIDPNEIKSMKAQPGKDILLSGGAQIDQAFMRLGLVDEYKLLVHPVILASGKALFYNLDEPVRLKLIHTRTLHSGAVLLHYTVA